MLGNLFEWINPSQSSFDSSSSGLRHVMLGSQVLLALQTITDLNRKPQSLSSFLDATVKILGDTTDFPFVAIELYSESAQDIIIAASTATNHPDNQRFSLTRDDISLRISKEAIDSQKTQILLANDQGLWESEPLFPFSSDISSIAIQTVIKVPMVVNQSVIGIVNLAHSERIEDASQLSFWGESLASYIGSLILNYQLDQQREGYTQRLQWLGTTLQGFTYEWDLNSGEVETNP